MRCLTVLLPLLATASITAASPAQAPSGYTLVTVTPVPTMPQGDFDQLVADVGHDRLYVSAEAGKAMDVFDLRTGALLQTGGPVASPHKVALDEKTHRLLVADGADASVKVLDETLALVARVPVGAKPDTGVVDPAARLFYVSSRDGGADATGSRISAISLDTFTVVKTYAVPGQTLKGMILDSHGRRLLVSVRDKNQIAVVHLDSGQVEAWAAPPLRKNVPLALDAREGLLFAGSRTPGELDVLDAASGQPLQVLPGTETADSMSFDAAHAVLYMSGDTGMSRYRVGPDRSVSLVSTEPGLVGKTSLYVAELKRLYVMRRRSDDLPAALQVFEPKD